MDNVEDLPLPDSLNRQFVSRLSRAVVLVAAAVAGHVWVVPGFHVARTVPATSVLSAGANLAPGSAAAVALLDAAAPARRAVRVHTELVSAGMIVPPAASGTRTRAVAVDTPPTRTMRPQATAESVRYAAVSLKETDPGTEPSPIEQMPSGRTHGDNLPVATLGASLAERPLPTTALGLSAGHVAAASTAAASAAMPASPTTAPDHAVALRRDEEIVREVLREYAQAFERLDVQAAKALWPTVDGRALQRAFQQLDGQQLRFASCGVSVSGRDANARCRGDATYRPKVGSRTLRL
ncbi:MAG: hypothetical protein ABJC51_10030, partial [Acidobacteriota bacterium]